MIGKRVELETLDGAYREGVLSGFKWFTVQVGGEGYDVPDALYLNDEQSDDVSWNRLAYLREKTL
jgi:hypothetical protein